MKRPLSELKVSRLLRISRPIFRNQKGQPQSTSSFQSWIDKKSEDAHDTSRPYTTSYFGWKGWWNRYVVRMCSRRVVRTGKPEEKTQKGTNRDPKWFRSPLLKNVDDRQLEVDLASEVGIDRRQSSLKTNRVLPVYDTPLLTPAAPPTCISSKEGAYK